MLTWPLYIKILFFTVISIICLSVSGYFVILYGGKMLVNEEKLILNAATVIETSDGKEVTKVYHELRFPVEIKEVPTYVQDAFVATEDRRFYEHAGVDMKSVTRAVFRDIIARSKTEGASTITQQLAKNLFLTNDKTWMRKTKEVMIAIYLDRHYSKKELLELYMNSIYFGHGVYGIEAAANKYFSKSVQDLTVAEGAMLVGIVKAPNGYSPINHPDKALTRRNTVLKLMEQAGVLQTEERVREQRRKLGLKVQEVKESPWLDSYIDLVLKEAGEHADLSIDELKHGGYRIVVNLDEKAQRTAYDQFKKEDYFPGNVAGVEGAFLLLEHHTGKIVAAVGGREFKIGDLNRTLVQRQPGSIFKPLVVYGPSLMKGSFDPFSVLPDEKMAIDGYEVSNSNNEYVKNISLYEALMQSKNTSAVWLLQQLGIPYAKAYLEKMQMNIPDEGLAIALGGLESGVTPLQIANAYATFANEGTFMEASTIKQIYNTNDERIYQSNENRTEVFSHQVAWNMTKMLQKTVEEGTASAGTYPHDLAGKTGTTQHPFVKGKSKDLWFAGYTPTYTAVTWMGYDRSDKDHYLTGNSSFPTELTKQILTELDKEEDLTTTFRKPDDVVDLPDPIKLPTIKNMTANIVFGGMTIVKGKLTWSGSDDERVVYRIYRKQDEIDEMIGEVTGITEYDIRDFSLLSKNMYYVVPYDPLTKLEGKPSEIVELSLN
ncbi:PBP1A family penicillin-binding protein [Virgibacillus soli]